MQFWSWGEEFASQNVKSMPILMNVALDKLIMKNPRIRSDYVRTEGKLLASLLRGWEISGAGMIS